MKNLKFDGEETAFLIRILKGEVKVLQGMANNHLKYKESKLEEYEELIQTLKVANNILEKISDWHFINMVYNYTKRIYYEWTIKKDN